MEQVSVLETNIGSSTTGNSANTQIIFNDNGTLRGDAGLVYNKTTDALTVGGNVQAASATITGDLTVDTNVLKVDTTLNRVGIGTASPIAGSSLDVRGAVGTGTDIQSLTLIDTSALAINNGGGLSFGYVFESPSTVIGRAGYIKTIKENATDGNYASVMVFGVTANGASTAERYRIGSDGTSTWSVAGTTAMTLNSTGLGIGVAPTDKLTLQSATDCALSLAKTSGTNKLYIITDGTTGWLASTAGATGKKIAYSLTCPDNSLTLDASGRLLLGKTASALGTVGIENSAAGYIQSTVTSDASLFCNRLATDGETIKFYRQTLQVGNISVTTLATTYNTISDYRLKEAVQPLVGGLARVNALKPSIYKWKANGSDGEGFLAHELASVVSAAVTGEKDAVNEDGSINAQSVDMSRIVPILVAAIQELTARVQTLEAR